LRGVFEIGEKTTKIAASNQIESSYHFTLNLFNFSDFIFNFGLFPCKFTLKIKITLKAKIDS
jgi:hypothetical protein